ncbi:hypothetical protein LJR232_006085 [Aquipseudomonas alcaligenes]
MKIKITLFYIALLFVGVPLGNAATLKRDHRECYSYLTELVRSSSFSFSCVSKEKVSLLIDDDSNGAVIARLVFDTEGTGLIGWVRYESRTRKLLNISAELDDPKPLTYDKLYAEQYEACISEG